MAFENKDSYFADITTFGITTFGRSSTSSNTYHEPYWPTYQTRMQQQQIQPKDYYKLGRRHPTYPASSLHPPDNTFALIKKSIKQIKAEAVGKEAQGRVEDKILLLIECGADAQASILEAELRLRQKLMALKEWDYKVLPAEEIGRFENEHRATATRDGLKVHIDPLEKYVGNPQSGDAKDRIIPDKILGELKQAKERKLFDTFHVLWVEKVKDPLLLGAINGCKDFFLIAEWGEDVKFDDIVKGE